VLCDAVGWPRMSTARRAGVAEVEECVAYGRVPPRGAFVEMRCETRSLKQHEFMRDNRVGFMAAMPITMAASDPLAGVHARCGPVGA